jgi:hypothetical protein
VTAKFEEVIFDADLVHFQQLLPNTRNDRLERRARRDKGIFALSLQVRLRQSFAIELPCPRPWQSLKENKRCRYQLLWQQLSQKLPQLSRDILSLFRLQYDVTNQLLVQVIVKMRRNGSFGD